METHPYIVVEGNIGSGKTSLVEKLSAHLNANAISPKVLFRTQ